MQEIADKLPSHIQKLVDSGVSGIDIIHGELKNLMYQAQAEYDEIAKQEEADDYSDAMLSMDRTRAEGYMDAYTHLYKLTYDIGFAERMREVKE
jgi:hypothetical protein